MCADIQSGVADTEEKIVDIATSCIDTIETINEGNEEVGKLKRDKKKILTWKSTANYYI